MIYTNLLSLLLANQKCSAALLCSADSIYPNRLHIALLRLLRRLPIDGTDRQDGRTDGLPAVTWTLAATGGWRRELVDNWVACGSFIGGSLIAATCD